MNDMNQNDFIGGEISDGNLVSNEYSTKDLYFAAFLSVKGLFIKSVEKYGDGNLGRVAPNQRVTNPAYFIFENRQRCEELEEAFWGGMGEEVMVNVKDYTNALRDLRNRAFSVTKIINNYQNQ